MPKGPRGEHRPADLVGCAVMVGRLATGEIAEDTHAPSGKVRSGLAGGKARAEKMSAEDRVLVAKKAANARWA